VVGQTQLLFFSALAFTLLLLSGIYPAEMRCINLDADWFYRKGGRLFFHVMDRTLNKINRVCERVFVGGITGSLARISKDVVPRFILLGMVSFWILTGSRGEVLQMKKMNVYNDFLKGTLPVGIGAGVAGFFIVLLFVLS